MTLRVSQPGVPCPVCKLPLSVRLAQGRKSKKLFVMFVCPEDGRHFRGFITYQPYVKSVLEKTNSLGVTQ